MQIKIKTDTTDIRAHLKAYTEMFFREMSSGVRQFAVVACRNLANQTQPFSGRDKETSQKGRFQGEAAVETDIRKIYYTAEVDGGFVKMLTGWAAGSYRKNSGKKTGSIQKNTDAFRKRMNKYIASGNYRALRETSKDMGFENFANKVDPAKHKAARTTSRRRVKRVRGGPTVILNKASNLSNYIKKRQKMVGLTKAGWAKCARLIPAEKKSSATRGIPQWVTRNVAKSSGSIIDLSRDQKNPRVVLTNKIPWASNTISKKEIFSATSLAKRNFVDFIERSIKAELRRRTKLGK